MQDYTIKTDEEGIELTVVYSMTTLAELKHDKSQMTAYQSMHEQANDPYYPQSTFTV